MLGRGAQGVVKLGFYDPGDGGEQVKSETKDYSSHVKAAAHVRIDDGTWASTCTQRNATELSIPVLSSKWR